MVVASLEQNQWSMNDFDLVVENTGNAPAFDIQVIFDPPLPRHDFFNEADASPFNRLSLLRPGQLLKSTLADYEKLKDAAFTVDVSWRRAPSRSKREQLSYSFDLAGYQNFVRLGEESPPVQIAKELKKVQEEWTKVAKGQRRLKIDAYSEEDRASQREQQKQRFEEQRTRADPGSGAQATDQSSPEKPAGEGY